MSTQIIPNCYHPDGTPCVAYTLQADGGSYHYTAPPVHHSVPEPSGFALALAAVACYILGSFIPRTGVRR